MRKKLECLGEMCPIPLLKAQRLLKDAAPGDEIVIVVDHSCVSANMMQQMTKMGFQVSEDEVMNGIWEITIRK